MPVIEYAAGAEYATGGEMGGISTVRAALPFCDG